MELIIENVLRVKNARIELSPKVTILAGNNAAGKSSTLLALAAVATGETLPLENMKKKDARFLVHDNDGAKSGSAELKFNGATNSVKWPTCKKSIDRAMASVYAAGLSKPSAIPAKDLTSILEITPTKDDLITSLKDYGELEDLEDLVESIWTKIQENGWDKAFDHSVSRRQDLKRQWSITSGVSWAGDKESGNWAPEDFTGKSVEELDQAISAAEKIYEYALKSQALNEKEKTDLQALADSEPAVQKQIEELQVEVADITNALDKARTLLSELPKILNSQQAYACWHCGELGVLQGEKLIQAPDQAKPEEVAASKARYDEQAKIVRDMESEKSQKEYALRSSQNTLIECQKAKTKLESVDLSAEPSIQPADAKADLERCKRERRALDTKLECDEIYQDVMLSVYLCDVLDPNGLQKDVLGRRLEDFNKRLEWL